MKNQKILFILTFLLLSITGVQFVNAQQTQNDMENNITQDTEEISLVCTLNDRELIERLQYLRDEIFTPEKVSAIEELDDGFKYIYDQPIDFSLKLVEFINFERKCCQGFRFALEFEPEEGPINLKIYGSEQIRDILDGMIENSDLNTLVVRRS